MLELGARMTFSKEIGDFLHFEGALERDRIIELATEEQPEKSEDNKLRGKRFRGRHADLRSGVHVNTTVAFARDRARDVVTNSQGAKTFALAFAQRTQRVRSFAALADGEDQRLRSHRRIAMAKLAGVIDLGRDVRQPLDQIFADSARMQRRAATREN